jgi:replicative DNA helicase
MLTRTTHSASVMERSAADAAGAPPFRTAPHNIEAEQALLGAILVNNEAHDRVSGFLEPHHFYDPLHQQIYETAAKLITSGKQATPITLKTFFEKAEPIDAGLTVPQYLGRLAANAATIINARDYGRTVHDLATRRQLILIGEDMVNVAFDSPVDFPPKEQIENAEARLFALCTLGTNERDAIPLVASIDEVIVEVDAAFNRGGGLAGLSTGIRAMDAVVGGGLVPGTLNILAGRPSMGKTALAINVATNVAKSGTPVLVFSLEMSAADLALRQLAQAVGVPASDLRRGHLTDTPDRVMRGLLQAREQMSEWPVFIDQSGGLTMPQIAAKARRMRRKHKVGLIVVDYLQLINGSVYRGHNRTQEVTEITNGLKALAKELGVSVLAVSQLSRALEARTDKRPTLADLRDSGSVEQDADAVMFVYREAYYLEREKPHPVRADQYADWQRKLAAAHGVAELIVAKLRNGPTGTAQLAFDAKTMTFSTLADGGRP